MRLNTKSCWNGAWKQKLQLKKSQQSQHHLYYMQLHVYYMQLHVYVRTSRVVVVLLDTTHSGAHCFSDNSVPRLSSCGPAGSAAGTCVVRGTQWHRLRTYVHTYMHSDEQQSASRTTDLGTPLQTPTLLHTYIPASDNTLNRNCYVTTCFTSHHTCHDP